MAHGTTNPTYNSLQGRLSFYQTISINRNHKINVYKLVGTETLVYAPMFFRAHGTREDGVTPKGGVWFGYKVNNQPFMTFDKAAARARIVR